MSASGPFQDKPSLRIDALSIERGQRVLFADLSLAVEAGGYVELRGANGSGKTSLLRAIAGFLKPRAGKIAFGGAEEPTLALHYVGHLNALKGSLTARAHVAHWRAMLGGGGDIDQALARFELTRQAHLPARVLSQGQARRLALTRLAAAPRPIWLLDEPAAALDDAGAQILAGVIAAHRAEGGLVIAAVHAPLGPVPTATVTVGA